MEDAVLSQIIELISSKIHSLLKRLNKPEVASMVHEKTSRTHVEQSICAEDDVVGSSFRRWIDKFSDVISLGSNVEVDDLKRHINWASRAKWCYSEQIESLFCSSGEELPPWINNIYKIGRYWVAAKVMVKLALKKSALFMSLHARIVDTPPSYTSSIRTNETSLTDVLQRPIEQKDNPELMQKLGKGWLTDDPEARFRKACEPRLTVHGEMQLLSFYDDHPELTPKFLFMELAIRRASYATASYRAIL